MRRIKIRHAALVLLLFAGGCTISVEPIRGICRGDSVSTVGQDTALIACSTLDSLARQ